jgi:hypothetical protein
MATIGTNPVAFVVDSQGVVQVLSGKPAPDTDLEFEPEQELRASDG